MADNQLLSPMPMITLDSGCTITVEAIDPASGAAVTGVTVSQVTIYGVNAAGEEVVTEEIDRYFVFTPDEI